MPSRGSGRDLVFMLFSLAVAFSQRTCFFPRWFVRSLYRETHEGSRVLLFGGCFKSPLLPCCWHNGRLWPLVEYTLGRGSGGAGLQKSIGLLMFGPLDRLSRGARRELSFEPDVCGLETHFNILLCEIQGLPSPGLGFRMENVELLGSSLNAVQFRVLGL